MSICQMHRHVECMIMLVVVLLIINSVYFLFFQLAFSFFDKCVEKMNAADVTPFRR